jgi:hypothetical protein
MFWSLAQSQVFKSYWDDAPTFVPKATMPEPLPEVCQKLRYAQPRDAHDPTLGRVFHLRIHVVT